MKIPYTKKEKEEFLLYKCPIYSYSKERNQINKVSINPRKFELLDKIYSDIGRLISKTYNNYKYYITFLNKAIKYLELYLLKNKTEKEVYSTFQHFKA